MTGLADYRILAGLQAPQIDLGGQILRGAQAGIGIGDFLRKRAEEEQLKQQIDQMVNPQTGEVNQGQLLRAYMQYDPKTGASLLPEMWKQRQQQQALEMAQSLATGQASGSPGTPGAAPGSPLGYNPRALGLAALSGLPGMSGYGNVATMMNAPSQEDYKRAQEDVTFVGPNGNQYTMPRGAYQQQLQGQQPSGAQPSGVQPSGVQPSGVQPSGVQPSGAQPSGAQPQGQPQTDIGSFQDKPYFSEAIAIAKTYGIDPKVFLSQIQQESGFNPTAKSPKGAMGLTQLMPDTAAALGVTDPMNPIQNLAGGAKYLRQMLDRYGGDYTKALAAYNAGPGAVDRHGGVPPYAETQGYVPAVLKGAGGGPRVSGVPSITPSATTTPIPSEAPPFPGARLTQRAPETQAGLTTTATEAAKDPYRQAEEARQAQRQQEQAARQAALDYAKQSQLEQQKTAIESANAYPLARAKKQAEEDVAMSKDWRTASDNATTGLQLVKDMSELAKQGVFKEGMLAGVYGKLGRILYASGAPLDLESVKENIKIEKYDSVAHQLTLAMLGGKLGAQISDADRNYIEGMLPQIGSNPEAAKGVLDRVQKAFDRTREKWTGWLQAKRANPQLTEPDYESQWQQHLTETWAKEQPATPAGGQTISRAQLLSEAKTAGLTPEEAEKRLTAAGIKVAP